MSGETSNFHRKYPEMNNDEREAIEVQMASDIDAELYRMEQRLERHINW